MQAINNRRDGTRIDEVDVRILAFLQSNGRMSMRDLGAAVGLSGPAATERVRRLEAVGVIRGYRADVVPAGVGRPLVAFVTVALPVTGRPAGAFEKFVERLEGVIECYRITGEDAYLVKVAVPTMDALGETLDQLGELGRTRSFVVLAETKRAAPLLPPAVESYSRTPPSGAD